MSPSSHGNAGIMTMLAHTICDQGQRNQSSYIPSITLSIFTIVKQLSVLTGHALHAKSSEHLASELVRYIVNEHTEPAKT